MAGLQGAGKTTATGKLGLYLKEKEKSSFGGCRYLSTSCYRATRKST